MGKPIAYRLGVRQLHLREQICGTPDRGDAGREALHHRAFDCLVDEPVGGIEGCGRTLGHIGDPGASKLPSAFFALLEKIATVEGEPVATAYATLVHRAPGDGAAGEGAS
jgi:hypothetical protein